ncbi:MAG: hypothetical protein FK734_06055 [Asgard group archaeon]|nr:hypothetical protein [Asgard group archaeon]
MSMSSIMNFFKKIYNELLFISIVFLIYFQVLNVFITNVYALNFAIMGIGPYTLLVVFFLSPPILLFFKKKFPIIGIYVTVGLLAISRILMVIITNTTALAFITGVGVSSFGIFLPAYLTRKAQEKESCTTPYYITVTQGLAIAFGLILALKAIGNSYDYSVFGLGRILTGVFVVIVCLMLPGLPPESITEEEQLPLKDEAIVETESEITPSEPKKKSNFGKIFLLSMGIIAIILIEWFALAYPTAFARWSDSSYLIVSVLTLGANILFLILITFIPKLLSGLKIWILTILNVLLITSLVLVAALPQPQLSVVQIVFTYIAACLSPVALLDFMVLTKKLNKMQPSARTLGGTFGISSLIFLIVTFLMVSSFNYEWVPGMLILKDRFYILIILTSLLFLFPVIFVKGTKGFLKPAFKKPSKKLCRTNQIMAIALIVIFAGVSSAAFGLYYINPAAQATPTTLTIMTYNVHQGEDKLGQNNFERILTSVKKYDPDILALQESDTARICFGNIDLVRYLAENLNMYYYYGPKTVTGVYGVATLSKYPIEFTETYFMPSGDHSKRVIIRTDLRIGIELITFYNTHFGLEHEERTPQAEYVRDLTVGATRTFMCGDFNTKDNETEYPIFTTSFLDSWLEINPSGLNITGWNGDTNRFPQRRIDYILFTPDFTILDVSVLTWAVESDHWPVLSIISL